MAWNKWKRFGPFDYFRLKNGNISAWLHGHENVSWGWEWGSDSSAERNPLLCVRIGRLVIFSFEKFKKGFEARLFGFWWIR